MKEKEEELISVIIPVYNVKAYLERCVNSVLTQTYRHLEILLIDDGSTDGSASLCDSLAAREERIRVIHRENGGAAAARNTGLDTAAGELIAFADADDFLHPELYARMLRILEERDADIVTGEFLRVPQDADPEEWFAAGPLPSEASGVCIEKSDVMRQLFERDRLTVVLWNKLFRRHVLRDVSFPEGRTFEDFFAMHHILWNCERMVYTEAAMYFYAEREESVSRSLSHAKIRDSVDGHEDRVLFFREHIPEMSEMAEAAMLENMEWRFSRLSAQGAREDCIWFSSLCREKLEKLQIRIRDDRIRRIIDSPKRYYRQLRIKQHLRKAMR